MAKISYSEEVDMPVEILWHLLLDKTEHPDRTIKEAKQVKILERYEDGILREMTAGGITIREHIKIDELTKTIRFDLVGNSLFRGYFVNRIDKAKDGKIVLTYEQDWTPLDDKAKELEGGFYNMMKTAVKEMKRLAEN